MEWDDIRNGCYDTRTSCEGNPGCLYCRDKDRCDRRGKECIWNAPNCDQGEYEDPIKKSPLGYILAGGGGVIGIAVLLIILCCCYCKYRNYKPKPMTVEEYNEGVRQRNAKRESEKRRDEEIAKKEREVEWKKANGIL